MGGRGCGLSGGNSTLPLLGLVLMRLAEGVGDEEVGCCCCCCVMAIDESLTA